MKAVPFGGRESVYCNTYVIHLLGNTYTTTLLNLPALHFKPNQGKRITKNLN